MKGNATALMRLHLEALDIDYVEEYRFHPIRRWRFDFAIPDDKIAIEIEGMGGRHQTMKGFRQDLEKYMEAFAMGWQVLRCSTRQVEDHLAITALMRRYELDGMSYEINSD